MKHLFILSVIALLISAPAVPAQADVVLVPTNYELDVLHHSLLVEYLSATPPAATHIYAVTHLSQANGYIVSVAALNPATIPPYIFNVEDPESVIWTGSFKFVNGAFQSTRPAASCHDCARMPFDAGGGPEIFFPWQAGKAMMFGSRGVHEVNGKRFAVDWLSGDGFGADAAGPTVYASAPGRVDYVCYDTVSAMVKIMDDGTSDYISYYHFSYDANYQVEEKVYARGEPMGVLKYGSFSTNTGYCGGTGAGWASQQDTNYHLHQVFTMGAGSKYQMEGWILDIDSQVWTRGAEKVRVGQWMYGGGGVGTGIVPDTDDPTAPPSGSIVIDPLHPENLRLTGASFWDGPILAANTLLCATAFSFFPSATGLSSGTQTMLGALFRFATMFVQYANLVLVNDIINLMPVIIVIGVILGIETIYRAGETIIVIVRFIYNMIPTAA